LLFVVLSTTALFVGSVSVGVVDDCCCITLCSGIMLNVDCGKTGQISLINTSPHSIYENLLGHFCKNSLAINTITTT
jgi:hypothetical protein